MYDRRRVDYTRIRIVSFGVACIMFVLLVTLWKMQILEGEHHARLARNNRIRLIHKPAPRGIIYDMDGNVLVDNRPGFDVEILPEDVEQPDLCAAQLSGILGIDEKIIRERMRGYRVLSYLPVKVAWDVSLEEVTAVEERKPGLAGVNVGVYPRRRYPHGMTAAHCLGYVGKIGPNELERSRDEGYTQQDIVGRNGLERQYEAFLRGKAGGEEVQVDSRGYLDKVLYRQDPENGCSLNTTIHYKAQCAAEAALGENTGVVVALDPRSGAVRVLASRPAFDPNDLIPPVSAETVEELFRSERHPMMNRALRGLYSPGSVFKPVVACSGLSSGLIDDDTTFTCKGVFYLGKHPYRCWYEKGHGNVNVVDAIMLSCNVFFYQTGLLLGRDGMAETACAFGVNEVSGIDLPGEYAGVVPTEEWCRANGIRWYPGDSVVMAIGQGYLLVTPLRAAMIMAAIANGGDIYRPYLMKSVVSPMGDTVRKNEPYLIRPVGVKREVFSFVREGLRRGVNSVFGTGKKARLEGIEVAGKTGTVQVGPPERRRHHSWFVGFAPFEQPELVVAVLIEWKESGGFYAAPAAQQVMKAYFGIP